MQQGNVGLVTSCGKFQRKAGSGCHILNPFVCEAVSGYVSTRIQQLDTSVETKTKDNVFVTCIVSVQYQVRRASNPPPHLVAVPLFCELLGSILLDASWTPPGRLPPFKTFVRRGGAADPRGCR